MTGCDGVKHIHVYIEDAVPESRREHSALELGLVLHGSVQIKSQSNQFTVMKNSVFLLNAYTPYWMIRTSDEAQILYVQIKAAFCREYLARLSNISFQEMAVLTLAQAHMESIRQHLLAVAMSYFQKSAAYQLDCMGQVSLLLAELLRTVPYRKLSDGEVMVQKNSLSRAQRIKNYIEKHYRQKLTLSDIAREEGVSAAYVSQIFRQLLQMPFQQYLIRQRLSKALPLLRDPSVHLVDVCLECGFSDTKYLNKICQEYLGCSAQEYRSGVRRKELPVLEDFLPERKYTDRDSLGMLREFVRKSV